MSRQLWLSVLTGLAALVILVIGTTWLVSGSFTDAQPHDIGRPPPEMEASNVTMVSSAGHLVHGWLSSGQPGHGIVLLLHGLSNDRRAMLPRAQFLRKLGYGTLLIDFQANGETRGNFQTFGEEESQDVFAAIQYLHHKVPNERVGVLGVTLGAAALVLQANKQHADAVVLDTLYPTLEEAIEERVRSHIGPFATLLTPLLYLEVKSRVPFDAQRVKPIAFLSQLGAPVLMICGGRDPVTTPAQCRAMFAAAPQPRQLWEVPEAGHVDLYRFASKPYEERVGDFFAGYLVQQDVPAPAGAGTSTTPPASPVKAAGTAPSGH
jgi:uncharacterized protein